MLGSRCVIVGVAGGTGSGKSTLVRRIMESLAGRSISVIRQDNYYKDRTGVPLAERATINYDHPDALDNELLVDHLHALQQGQAVEVPVYDFTIHNRKKETVSVQPTDVIIVEGILVLECPALRALLDLKLFVDTDADIRFIRRLTRDMAERGRTMESVIEQYVTTVRPMHLEFVEPSKRYADVIIPEGGMNEAAISMITARLDEILRRADKRPRSL
ncbi:MAG: uridine kinase [Chloroflexota bacterium]